MKIIVTGHRGYLGSAICDKFKHEIIGLDIKDGSDIRNIELPQADAVIHLAGISKEPTGDFSPREVDLTNHIATENLARQAKDKGMKFIYASSASVYFTFENIVSERTEDESVTPISVYALSKRSAEEALLELSDDNFQPVILRKGTVYGYSPNTRRDLVVQKMTEHALKTNVVTVFGNVYRPMLDIQDAVKAYEMALTLPGGIYNAVTKNWSIKDLGEEIARVFGAKVEYKEAGISRNYRASGEKLGLSSTRDLSEALYELKNKL